FTGSNGYQDSPSNSVTQQVQEATTTGVTSSGIPSAFATAPTFTATVTDKDSGAGTPTGTVEFFDGSTDLGPGSALSGSGNSATSTFPPSSPLTVGTHHIIAVFTGSGGYQNSDNKASPFLQQVAENTTTTVGASGSPSAFGTSVTFTATVSDDDSGAGVP